MSAYERVVIDLATVTGGRRVIDGTRNAEVDSVTVLKLPAGANITLAFGDGGDELELLNQGISFDLCPPERNGVFYNVPAAGAGEVVLLVSFAEGSVQARAN